MHIFLVVIPSEARDLQLRSERRYYVYIMASRSLNLYTGITDNVYRRALEHKSGSIGGFTKRYNINRLVHLAEGWGAKTELQIPRDARDDNQFEHTGGLRSSERPNHEIQE